MSHVAEGPVPAQGPVDPHWYWRVPSNNTGNRTICACVAKMLADAVTKLPHWLALPKLPKQTKLRKPKKGAKPAPTEARACESHCSLTLTAATSVPVSSLCYEFALLYREAPTEKQNS